VECFLGRHSLESWLKLEGTDFAKMRPSLLLSYLQDFLLYGPEEKGKWQFNGVTIYLNGTKITMAIMTKR
jgi:hypothetical protein